MPFLTAFRQLMHPYSHPVVLTLSRHWNNVPLDERVRLMSAQLSLTKIQFTRKSRLKKDLWRWASDETVGVDTLAAAAANLHTGDSGHVVVFRWILRQQ